ncbi:MAG: hypothetical protein K6F00_03875 [Lachnospiraceae bacterium]|nr:hypothetical protein [Lachnospiraceae bacterium]
MRIWFIKWKDNHQIESTVVEDYSEDTRTHKVLGALEKACYKFDLMTPIWLDPCIAEFKKYHRTRFYQDAFIEEIPFDFLEMRVLEED